MASSRDGESLYRDEAGRWYAACRLKHLTVPPGGECESLAVEHRRRRTAFLTSLINPGDERVIYDLRLVGMPDREAPARGRIELALLCRLEGATAEEVGAKAGEMLDLLDALFDDHQFELATAEEVKVLLLPFPIKYITSVRRRVSLEELDTLRGGYRRPRPGFLSEEPAPEAAERHDEIFHVFPYIVPGTSAVPFYRLLLAQRHPIAISFRVQPTTLAPEEEAFLEDQIARCERYAQIGLERIPEDVTSLRPALREQAQLYQRYQSRILLGLKDNAAVATLDVASPGAIPAPIVDVLGGLISEPAGGGAEIAERGLERYLAGGYEVIDCSGESGTIEAFWRMDLALAPYRLAPPGAERLPYLFDSLEASAGLLLPEATTDDVPGFEIGVSRTLPAPRELPAEGRCLGVNRHRRQVRTVRIAPDDRRRHVYVVGQTGTGKTTLLKTLIVEDMRAGDGLCVIDPHGDLFRDLLGMVPEDRIGDVVVLDPTDTGYPVGLNLLEYESESQRHFIAQELVAIITRLMEDEFGSAGLGAFAGPLFFQHMRMNLLLAMSNPKDPGTLLEFYTIFQEKDYWRRWLPLKISDPMLERWVENVLPQLDYTKPGSEGSSMGGYVGSKFEGFIFDPLLRNLFGQKRSTIDLRRIMDEGKILLVNLAKGELTEPNSRYLGMVLLAKLMAAALGRVSVPERDRRIFHLYVDEFQSVATQSFVTLLSEARKFGVTLVLANQFLRQMKDERILQAIFGNVGTLVVFRVGQADAEILWRELAPRVTQADLVNLRNWQAYVATLIGGQTVPAFSLTTVIPQARPADAVAAKVRRESQAAYGREHKEAEREVARSLAGGGGIDAA